MGTLDILVGTMTDSLPSGAIAGLGGVIILYLLYKKPKFTVLFVFILLAFWSCFQFFSQPDLEEANIMWPLTLGLLGFLATVYVIYLFTQGET